MAENNTKKAGKEVFMDVKDSFFDDPFFRGWWNDFDAPMKDKTLQRQISGKNKQIFPLNEHIFEMNLVDTFV